MTMTNVETKQMDLSFKIADPSHQPNDTVQVLKFCPNNPQLLAAGSWDETVRVYQLQQNKTLTQQVNINVGGPALDLSWTSSGTGIIVATGAANNNLLFLNLATSGSPPTPIGTHPGVLCIYYIMMNQMELLLTLGADKSLRFWMQNGGRWEQKVSVPLKKMPVCLDVDLTSNLVLIGLECDLGIYRLNKLMSGDTSVQYFELQLKSPINCLAIRDRATEVGIQDFKQNDRSFVACASDGRASMSELSLDANSTKKDIILFKAHSKGSNLYSINACGFSKLSQYCMYTCGSDGHIYFWDTVRKLKLTSYIVSENIPICSADLSANQQLFAFSTGYDWSQGVWGTARCKIRPNIYIHQMTRADHRRD